MDANEKRPSPGLSRPEARLASYKPCPIVLVGRTNNFLLIAALLRPNRDAVCFSIGRSPLNLGKRSSVAVWRPLRFELVNGCAKCDERGMTILLDALAALVACSRKKTTVTVSWTI